VHAKTLSREGCRAKRPRLDDQPAPGLVRRLLARPLRLGPARRTASLRLLPLRRAEPRARPAVRPPEGGRRSSARAHLGLAADPLTDLAPARKRIDDWRAFLEEGLDPKDDAALRAAERSGRLR
jgi:hypothetical protein